MPGIVTMAEQLAEFATDVTFARLPGDVTGSIRRRLLDLTGCMLAAAASGEAAATVEAVRAWAGSREAGVPGCDFRAPAPHAALAGGTLAAALMHDAVHLPTLAPIDAAVIPASLATAEEAGRDGRALVEAIAIGLEIAARLADAEPEAAMPAGAAASAARAWGLSERETASAIAIAATSPAAAAEHRARPGWSAMNGVIAADLARRGVAAGDDRPGPPQPETGAWACLSVALKPYPAVLWLQACIDAAASLGLKPGDVEEVLCSVPAGAAAVVCEPRAGKIRPVSDAHARTSLPFAVASAIVGGRSPAEMFGDDARGDRRVLGLAERVGYEEDPALGASGGRVRIMLRDGRTREATADPGRGSPGAELSEDDLRGKFVANARRRLDQPSTAKLASQLLRIDEIDDIGELIALAQGNV